MRLELETVVQISPLTTQALKLKLKNLWPYLSNWTVTPLGKGCFEFKFNSIEDMRKILAQGVIVSYCV